MSLDVVLFRFIVRLREVERTRRSDLPLMQTQILYAFGRACDKDTDSSVRPLTLGTEVPW